MSTALLSSKTSTPEAAWGEEYRVEDWLAPLDRLTETSNPCLSKSLGRFDRDGQNHQIPRYIYVGPKGGGDVIRIGIFAAIHGDEPEGTLALSRLVDALEAEPELARGYALFLYPICNPTGLADRTRHARSGKDLNREFWKGSAEPEVRYLETEIRSHDFHGIVTLHSDDTSDGLYGFVNGVVLSEHLLEPALREAERFLPRNRRSTIDGFSAHNGIIHEGYQGVLRAVPGLERPPFELTLETPQGAPWHRQVEALAAALKGILVEYRSLMAVGQNI